MFKKLMKNFFRVWGMAVLALVCIAGSAYGLSNSEVNASFQFNFNNPGSRAAGMGGAFISQADDATAAYANPACIFMPPYPEVSIEMKQNRYTVNVPNYYRDWSNEEYENDGSGSREFTESLFNASFASYIYPIETKSDVFRRLSFAVYRHELVKYEADIHTKTFDIGGKWSPVFPTLQSVDFSITDYGFSFALGELFDGRLALGATLRFSQYEMDNDLKRYNIDPYRPADEKDNTSDENMLSRWSVDDERDDDISFIAGIYLRPFHKLPLKMGAVYRQGPKFEGTEIYKEGPATNAASPVSREYDYTLKIPDSYGFGISYQFAKSFTLAFDYVRVEYSDLMDNFAVSVDEKTVTANDYEIEDADEYHIGLEYVMVFENSFIDSLTFRGGYWYNPDHSLQFVSSKQEPDIYESQRLIFSGGEDDHNYTFGLGASFGGLRIDFAGNMSDYYDAYSVSLTYVFK
jgi:long-subunit fatty acid transport protein